MYQPYPGGADRSAVDRPTPSPVRQAVLVMYVGAALSVIRVIVVLVTKASLKADIASRAARAAVPLTASQINAAETAAIVFSVVVGVIGAGLWIVNARGSADGQKWAQVTGTVLFGLDTLALLIGPGGLGITGGQPVVDRICTAVVWLAGLSAVVLLWQRSSRGFFGRRQA